jgi:hypothetical protein
MISKNNYVYKEICNVISDSLLDSIDSAFSLKTRVQKEFNIQLEDNQIEIVEVLNDPHIKNTCIVASRSGGKTFGVIAGITLLSINQHNNKPITIGITAPKLEQATRIISTFRSQMMLRSPTLKAAIDERLSTNTKIIFKNGSFWEAFSGDVMANEEGRHYDILVMDEAQRLSDISVSNVLLPMVASSAVGKIVKLGVPRHRNHFYKSFKSSNYVALQYDWLHCGNLLKSGFKEIDGVKYPLAILNKMPYSKTQQYFPNNPELWVDGDMTVEDFETQHEIKWLLNVDNLLSEEDHKKLIGDFEPKGPESDIYFFGLDLAGGSLVQPGGDYTQLTVGRVKDGVKRIEAAYTFYGEITTQISEILNIIHPKYGLYRCKFGLADYGNLGSAVVDMMKHEGVDMDAIMFGSRDSSSGKNMKNAMYDHCLFEIRSDRFKYPTLNFISKNTTFKQHIDEWVNIERHASVSINDRIMAPPGQHDDCCSSAILLAWCIDKAIVKGLKAGPNKFIFPRILKGTSIVK